LYVSSYASVLYLHYLWVLRASAKEELLFAAGVVWFVSRNLLFECLVFNKKVMRYVRKYGCMSRTEEESRQ
jgi:hypothetical protein